MRVPFFFAMAAIATGAALPAQAATRGFPASGFTHVDLKSAASVTVSAGPSFSVRAEGDPRLLERLTADVRGDTLVLGWTKGPSVHVENQRLHVMITMPRVAGVSVSGAGSVDVDRAEAPDFTAAVAGAGTVRIGTLRAASTTLSMSGTGEIVAAGTTNRLDTRVSGVGSIDTRRLVARGGSATMSGTGNIQARYDGPVEATMSGLGSIEIGGSPRCTVHKSGLGSIHCG